MLLKEIKKKNWTICAIQDEKGCCELLDWLGKNQADANFRSSAVGLIALFEHVAENGIQDLSDKLSHQIDAKYKLYEFIKGKLRVIYFVDADKIIVCTHGFNKTQVQKTPDSERDKAIKLKSTYKSQSS
jgi:phage-related protein